MSRHTLSPSTHTVEMAQLLELNQRLRTIGPTGAECPLITAELLGLSGATVDLRLIDQTALIPRQERRAAGSEPQVLLGAFVLRQVVAAGAPTFPYMYGLFAEGGGGRRRLPAALHSRHLRGISTALQLHQHRWGS